jgi:hypothetical protein
MYLMFPLKRGFAVWQIKGLNGFASALFVGSIDTTLMCFPIAIPQKPARFC